MSPAPAVMSTSRGALGGLFGACGVSLCIALIAGAPPVHAEDGQATRAGLPQASGASASAAAPRHVTEGGFAALVSEQRLRDDVRALVALGPRMGGTPSGDRASTWLADRFRELGLDVRVEVDPPKLAHWHDGWSMTLEPPGTSIASAYPFGFSPDVPIGTTAPLVFVEDLATASLDPAWTGKALYTRTSPGRALGRLRSAGVTPALVITSAPHREGAFLDWAALGALAPRRDHDVAVFAVSLRDGRRLEAAAGRHNRVGAHLETSVDQRPVRTVIATLPGQDASRYFLLSAHGDSDSGGPGADDNASGEATVLEVARVLVALGRAGALAPPPVSVRFAIWGSEYHSSKAYIDREADALAGCLGVVNFDQTGTGAERESIYFESNDVPWNARLLRTLEQVGRDYLGQPGFWPEFATNPSQGGTDSYAFLPREHHGAGHTTRQIPATTVYTAAWDETRRLAQTPGWTSSGNGESGLVVVDYSRYYHSAGDTPDHTTEREPQNMVRAVKAGGLALLRLVYRFAHRRGTTLSAAAYGTTHGQDAEHRVRDPLSLLRIDPRRGHAAATRGSSRREEA